MSLTMRSSDMEQNRDAVVIYATRCGRTQPMNGSSRTRLDGNPIAYALLGVAVVAGIMMVAAVYYLQAMS